MFSHDAEPPKIMELCKFYLFERCAKREKCLYLHKGFPCKYFHTGQRCLDTDETCIFSHSPLNEETRAILLKHLESAPKEILGDFPRMTRNQAMQLIYNTEAKHKEFGPDADRPPEGGSPSQVPAGSRGAQNHLAGPNGNLFEGLNMNGSSGPMGGPGGLGGPGGGINGPLDPLGPNIGRGGGGGSGPMRGGRGGGGGRMRGGPSMGMQGGGPMRGNDGPMRGPMDGPPNMHWPGMGGPMGDGPPRFGHGGPMNGPPMHGGPMGPNGPMFGGPNGPMNGPNNSPMHGPNNGPMMGPNNGPNGCGPMMGPNNGPMMGPNNGPMMGPNNGPMMGPNNGPMMGPNNGPMMGPNSGPMMGPNNGPMMGPNNGPMSGPSNGVPTVLTPRNAIEERLAKLSGVQFTGSGPALGSGSGPNNAPNKPGILGSGPGGNQGPPPPPLGGMRSGFQDPLLPHGRGNMDYGAQKNFQESNYGDNKNMRGGDSGGNNYEPNDSMPGKSRTGGKGSILGAAPDPADSTPVSHGGQHRLLPMIPERKRKSRWEDDSGHSSSSNATSAVSATKEFNDKKMADPEEDTGRTTPMPSPKSDNDDDADSSSGRRSSSKNGSQSPVESLPKTAGKLFERIQQKQRLNEPKESDISRPKRDSWYSSDEEEAKRQQQSSKASADPNKPTPAAGGVTLPKELTNFLGKLAQQKPQSSPSSSAEDAAPSASGSNKDPRGAARDPRKKRDPRMRGGDPKPETISEKEKERRILDLDLGSVFGDLELPTFKEPSSGGSGGDLSGSYDPEENTMGLPFKPHMPQSVAKEIDASIYSHSPLNYKMRPIQVAKPDYSDVIVKHHIPASQACQDPRLRRYSSASSPLRSPPPTSSTPMSPPASMSSYNPGADLQKKQQSSSSSSSFYGSGLQSQPQTEVPPAPKRRDPRRRD